MCFRDSRGLTGSSEPQYRSHSLGPLVQNPGLLLDELRESAVSQSARSAGMCYLDKWRLSVLMLSYDWPLNFAIFCFHRCVNDIIQQQLAESLM